MCANLSSETKQASAVSSPSLISGPVGPLTPAYVAPYVCGGTAKLLLYTVGHMN